MWQHQILHKKTCMGHVETPWAWRGICKINHLSLHFCLAHVGMKHQDGFAIRNKPTAHSSCSFALLWVVCVSTLLIPRGCCCCWPIGSWDCFFFFSKGREQMKWWDSCNFWMTPAWQRQSSSIVLSHYSLLLCHGAFCIFCWFLCWTPCLQVRP